MKIASEINLAPQNVANVPPIYKGKPYTKMHVLKMHVQKRHFYYRKSYGEFHVWRAQFFGDKIFKVTVLSRCLELSEPSTYGTIGTMGVLSISMLKTMIPGL